MPNANSADNLMRPAEFKPGRTTEFLPVKAVRQRYGHCSEATLDRWLKNPDLGFPKPLYIGPMRWWRVDDLEAFERQRPTDKQRAGTKPPSRKKTAE